MARPLPGTLPMIRALIEQPSISCTDPHLDQSNLEVIHLLANWAEGIGFHVEIDQFSPLKANLIATLGPLSSSEIPGGLILSGHTDTVPCNPELWKRDPFKATEIDHKMYGLGSADMKSFLALMLEAASKFRKEDLQQPLVLIGTADEESSMSGARALVTQNRRLGRQAIIGEPTGLKPIRMHKGVIMASISVHGRSGHSSDPSFGVNAIEGMHHVLGEIIAFREELKNGHRNPAFLIDYPTLNLGAIRGGDNPNRICGHCQTQIDIRPLPGMNLDLLLARLEERLGHVLSYHPELRLEVNRLTEGVPAFETDKNREIIRAVEEMTGQEADAVAFGTEAPFISALGADTVVLGPGYISQAHQPDEYLPLDHIEPCIGILSQLINRFCVQAPSA